MNYRDLSAWLPTGPAAKELAVSPTTLKRYADRDGFLTLGVHWRYGAHKNSPRIWNLRLCQQALDYRSRVKK
ncbi:hypothetical protein KBZ12_17510 [Cyanobium sp. Cruz CV13-4-11]|jgi:hypothetical protein|uniref:hypothetical protein n=1 Tax=Cyanobium sp. Cruz CV11-17 TaxID=2823709 RepID=UPI0020CC8078|nr:hypothetical protein [Cyanobium sp. Cruz CV11-17]MCP9902380.1 hypothetical protein [Cyanobium sp. Cruz CV11-17]MCP9921238.1 hypothetical protein [Cyanobium sp. Cruz CV13-4-11]